MVEGGEEIVSKDSEKDFYSFFGRGLRIEFKRLRKEDEEVCRIRKFEIIPDFEPEERLVETINEQTKLSLFGPEYFRESVIGGVSLQWNLRKRRTGCYYVVGDLFELKIGYTLKEKLENLRIGIPFFNNKGEMLLGPDTRAYSEKESLGDKGDHELCMQLDPLPVNVGRLWLTLTICQDPAHLYRKHIEAFDVINSKNEYGMFFTDPLWGRKASNEDFIQLDF